MKIKEIISKLEKLAPPAIAEEWDNVGLMLGSVEDECRGVALTLDVTRDVILQAEAEGCNLIVSHHPYIFHAIKRVDYSEGAGATLKMLVERNITVYSMHTNLDKAEDGLNATLSKLIGGKDVRLDGVGALCTIEETKLSDFAKHVARVLDDNSVRGVGDKNKPIKSVYVVSGSGASEYERARQCADVLLTGDFKHHNYMDAERDGFALVEYSHFASEIISQNILENALSGANVKIIKVKQQRPFWLLEEV